VASLDAPLIGIVGWSGAGKTTLIERLLANFVARGLKVATIKHAHHALRPGDNRADGARHARAGAFQVMVIGPQQWEIAGVLQDAPPPGLDEAAACLGHADLILVEGFKSAALPKIEVRRAGTSPERPLADGDPHIVAIASDHPVATSGPAVFALDDVEAIAAFIAKRMGLSGPHDHLRSE